MKKMIMLLVLLVILSGCSNKENSDASTNLKEALQQISSLENSILENEKDIEKLKDDQAKQNTILEKNMGITPNFQVLSDYSDEIIFQHKRIWIFEDLLYKFIETSSRYEEIYCYVDKYDENSKQIEVDIIEFLTHIEDQEKLSSLGIDDDTLPNGYYIYNEVEESEILEIDKYSTCIENELSPKLTNKDTFFDNMIKNQALCKVILVDGRVFQILEKYLP